jgi:hypothetical protein
LHRASADSALLTPSTPLRPGSEIQGTVKFHAAESTTLDKVTVTLSGRCKVKIREHLHYTTRTFRSRGYFFYLTQEIFAGGGYTHKAGHYDWPFQIFVPKYAHPQWEIDSPQPGRPRRVLDSNGMMKVETPEDQDARGGGYDSFPARKPWRGSKDIRQHHLPDSKWLRWGFFTCSIASYLL